MKMHKKKLKAIIYVWLCSFNDQPYNTHGRNPLTLEDFCRRKIMFAMLKRVLLNLNSEPQIRFLEIPGIPTIEPMLWLPKGKA